MTSWLSRLRRLGFFVSLSLLVLVSTVSAQHVATYTTISAAVDASQNTITVASATNFAAGSFVWIDHELMAIRSVSGTTITVRRGVETQAAAHPSGAKATVSSEVAGQVHFYTYDPDFHAACTRGTGQASVVPWINKRTGTVWVCRDSGAWSGTNIAIIVFNSDPATYTGD